MKNIKKGSLTVEMALLTPVILLVIFSVLYLFFWVHNRAWLSAAAYEAAIDGSMECYRTQGNCSEKALEKGMELGNTGFFESENLNVHVEGESTIQVIYDLDMFSVYGEAAGHLQVCGKRKCIDPVSWIRKQKGILDVFKKTGGD